jgi:hypothetical protein
MPWRMKAPSGWIARSNTRRNKAILIDDGDQEMWLPKSVIEIDRIGDGTAIVFVPEWLAKKLGLD